MGIQFQKVFTSAKDQAIVYFIKSNHPNGLNGEVKLEEEMTKGFQQQELLKRQFVNNEYEITQ